MVSNPVQQVDLSLGILPLGFHSCYWIHEVPSFMAGVHRLSCHRLRVNRRPLIRYSSLPPSEPQFSARWDAGVLEFRVADGHAC